MQTEIICWGHNPGQRYVKDAIISGGKRREPKPYPAVIAPWAQADDDGLGKHGTTLTATVGGATYLGGSDAERLPLANRQQDRGRLDAQSPIYPAFAQMSAAHAGLTRGVRPTVAIASAVPVGWRLDDKTAAARLEGHIRAGLTDLVKIAAVYVISEPNAVVASELFDDAGEARREAADLAAGVVCVGDIGGGTLNHSVLDSLKPLAGQADSPPMGSSAVVRDLARRAGMQYVDAERRLEAAVTTPGKDPIADALLRQFRESVVTTFQEAWKAYAHAPKLFAGGTIHWVVQDLTRAFGQRARVHARPQHAVAIGLAKYAARKSRRSA